MQNELLNWLLLCLTVHVPKKCNHYIIFLIKLHTISLFFFKYMYYQSSFYGCKCISLFYRNIRTVSIQIEITKYLYKCLTNPDPEVTMPTPVSDSKRPYLPTMFGNTKTRTDLVNMVLMSHLYLQDFWLICSYIHIW